MVIGFSLLLLYGKVNDMETVGFFLKWLSLWGLAAIAAAALMTILNRGRCYVECDLCCRTQNVDADGRMPARWGIITWPIDEKGTEIVWGVACNKCFDNGIVDKLVKTLNDWET